MPCDADEFLGCSSSILKMIRDCRVCILNASSPQALRPQASGLNIVCVFAFLKLRKKAYSEGAVQERLSSF